MTQRTFTSRLVKRGEKDDFDRDFWRKAGHEARWAAMWEMVVEAELIRGHDAGELRLQRTVQHIKRRKR